MQAVCGLADLGGQEVAIFVEDVDCPVCPVVDEDVAGRIFGGHLEGRTVTAEVAFGSFGGGAVGKIATVPGADVIAGGIELEDLVSAPVGDVDVAGGGNGDPGGVGPPFAV